MLDKIFNERKIHANKYYLNEGKYFLCNKNSVFRRWKKSLSCQFFCCLTGGRGLGIRGAGLLPMRRGVGLETVDCCWLVEGS